MDNIYIEANKNKDDPHAIMYLEAKMAFYHYNKTGEMNDKFKKWFKADDESSIKRQFNRISKLCEKRLCKN